MVLGRLETIADPYTMTALNVFERTGLRPIPRCDRCNSAAWATTPHGLRCQEHALEEMEDAIQRREADWMPRRLKHRRF